MKEPLHRPRDRPSARRLGPLCTALAVSLILLRSVAATTAAQAGPSLAGTCSGYSLTPADAPNIQSIIDAKPGGTAFCFGPGVYRMTDVIIPKGSDKLIGAGATRADVILTGAKVLTGWTASSGLYVHSGDVVSLLKGGNCYTGTECQYSDWLFRGGLPMTRVLSTCSSTKVLAGDFCVDYSGKKIYVHDDPTGQTMSYSYVPRAIGGSGTGVVVKDMTFDKFASPVGGAKTIRAGTGWLVDNVVMQYNHGCAIGLDGTSGTVVQNSRFHDNGQLGYCGTSTGAKFQNNEVDHNNFLGVNGPWGGGGGKFTQSVNVTVANNNVHDNNGNGIWFDMDSKGGVISGNTATNNSGIYGAGNGITYEISCWGTIVGNVSTGNGMSGIQLRSSHDTTIGGSGQGNTIANNKIAGMRVIVDRSGTQPHCGAITGSNNRFTANTVTMPSGTSLNGVQNFKPYTANGNVFSANHYYMPSGGCKATRWTWWNGSSSINAPFVATTGTTWQGSFRQDVGPGGTCQ
jgi:parallel beta-helix repeat protein